MAWTILNRVLGKAESADQPAPDMRSLMPVGAPGLPEAGFAEPQGAMPVAVAEAAQSAKPAFARKAAVEGGGPSLPAFAHSPFTPTRPILSERMLVGRRKQLDRAISAVQIERAHLTIFGERGNGKTSFSNVLAALAEDAGYGVVRHTCTTQPTFGELFGAVVAKIPPRFLRPVMAEEEAQSFGRRQIWTVASAVAKLQEIRAGHVLIMIDEFDRLSDRDALRDMTELLKITSDLSVRVSFVLIGVAQSLDDLPQLHPSLQRAMVPIPLPLLPDNDIGALLEQGCKDLRLSISHEARRAMLLLTQGSPYFAQLLSLHASDRAVRRRSRELTLDDVAASIVVVLDETRHSFEPMLAGLPRVDPRWPDLLFAAASAQCNGFGWFTAASASASAIHQGMALPRDLTFGLSVLASEDGGSILRVRRMPGVEEFSFSHLNLRNYILMREAVRRRVVGAPRDDRPDMAFYINPAEQREAAPVSAV